MSPFSKVALSACALSALTILPACAQTNGPELPKTRFGIGLYGGVFLPTDSKTRDRFGSSWVNLGLGGGAIQPAQSQGQVGVDASVLYQKRGDNHAFILPLGVQYRRAVGDGVSARPYVGASANVIFADLKSLQDNVHSGFKTGFGGSVFGGLTFTNRGFAEVRYMATTQIKSFSLSGLSFNVGYNL